jgi:hypothetical protein
LLGAEELDGAAQDHGPVEAEQCGLIEIAGHAFLFLALSEVIFQQEIPAVFPYLSRRMNL